MESTHIIGKDGTPVIVTGGHDSYGRRDDCVEEMIVQNTIHTGTVSNLNATHRNTADVLSAVAQGTRDSMEASNRNGIAGIKETSDVGRDNIRETSRAGSDNIRETARGASDNLRETARVGADLAGGISDLRSAIERTNGESRLATTISSGEIRELINTVGSANLMAIKDNGFAIREEGCKTREKVLEESYRTREKSAEQHAALQLQQCKDHAALLAQNAALDVKVSGLKEAICCCIKEATAGTEIKRLESALLDAKFAALGKDKPGNS